MDENLDFRFTAARRVVDLESGTPPDQPGTPASGGSHAAAVKGPPCTHTGAPLEP